MVKSRASEHRVQGKTGGGVPLLDDGDTTGTIGNEGIGWNTKRIYYEGTDETEFQYYQYGIRADDEPREWDTSRDNTLRPEEREKRDKRNLRRSQRRAKGQIYKLARANKWEWFITLTLNPDKVDRYDYDACRDKVRNQLKKMRRHYPDMEYLVVPELHEDGAYHFHGLVFGIPDHGFTDSGKTSSSGKRIYNVSKYTMGFTTATRVEDSGRAANYLSKYITKHLMEATPDRQRYWRSEGLQEPDEETFLLTEEQQHDLYMEHAAETQHVSTVEIEHGEYKEQIMYQHCKELREDERQQQREREQRKFLEERKRERQRIQREFCGPPDTDREDQPPPVEERPRDIPEASEKDIADRVRALADT